MPKAAAHKAAAKPVHVPKPKKPVHPVPPRASPPKAPKKKSATSWTSILGKAAKVALQLAPQVAPLLLASHEPTKLAVSKWSAGGGTMPVASSPTIASAGTLGNLQGLKDLKVLKRDNRGNALRVSVTTMDLVVAGLGAGTNNVGDILLTGYINPLDPMFAGTKFQEFLTEYSKFKVIKGCFMTEPTCPATAIGALTGACFEDPLAPVEGLSAQNKLRVMSSQTGADTWQSWSSGAFCIPPPGSDDYYVNPDGSDSRLSFQAKVIVMADTALNGTGGCNLYFMAECEAEIPTLAVSAAPGPSFYLKDGTTTSPAGATYSPLSGTWAQFDTNGLELVFMATTGYVSMGSQGAGPATLVTGQCLRGLTPGYWMFMCTSQADTSATGFSVVASAQLIEGGGAITLSESSSPTATITWDLNFVLVPAGMNPLDPQVGFYGFATAFGKKYVVANLVGFPSTDGTLPLVTSTSGLYALTLQGRQEQEVEARKRMTLALIGAQNHSSVDLGPLVRAAGRPSSVTDGGSTVTREPPPSSIPPAVLSPPSTELCSPVVENPHHEHHPRSTTPAPPPCSSDVGSEARMAAVERMLVSLATMMKGSPLDLDA